jgi:hypothetical protein
MTDRAEKLQTIQITNHPIPKNKMRQFHEILCTTGGRYIRNPRDCGDVIRCDYIPGDYTEQQIAWNLIANDIREIRKDQWWRMLLRRILKSVSLS